jgi:hypothetical protein
VNALGKTITAVGVTELSVNVDITLYSSAWMSFDGTQIGGN